MLFPEPLGPVSTVTVPGWRVECQVVGRHSVSARDGDAVESDRRPGRGQQSAIGVHRCVEQVEGLLGGGSSVHRGVELHADSAQRPEHLGRQQQGREGGGQFQLTEDESQADADGYQGDAERREKLQDERGHERDAQRGHRRTPMGGTEFGDAVGRSIGAAECAQRGDACDQVQHPRLQRGHRAQRGGGTVSGDQADECHEQRYQRECDHHDDGGLQVVVRHDHDRGRGQQRGQDHRRHVCGEVRPQSVESARRQERRVVSRGDESTGWKGRHRGEYAFVELGDDCRRTTLAEPGLPPLGEHSNHPRSQQDRQRRRPVCDRTGAGVGDDARDHLRHQDGTHDRAARDDQAATDGRDQVTPHRGGGGEALHVTRGDRPMDSGIRAAEIRCRKTQYVHAW